MFTGVNIDLMVTSGTAKRAYHHGDLRNALIDAAAELAAEGGPDSVTIRAAARVVGVTPTAAYRHFAGHEELLAAAKERAMGEMVAAMHTSLARYVETGDAVGDSLGRLAAAGRGYIAFALAQPGLFRTFCAYAPPEDAAGDAVDDPFRILLNSLDDLVRVGYLSPQRRELAEFTAWSLVHGLSTLLDGPLREMPDEVKEEVIARSIVTIGHGLAGAGLTPEQEAVLRSVGPVSQ